MQVTGKAAKGPKAPVTEWTERVIFRDQAGGHDLPAWLDEAYGTFREQVIDPAFPCFFGTQAERRGEMFYSYVDGGDLSHLPATMARFVELSALRQNEKNNFAIFFEPDETPLTHDGYRALFWRVLQHLHDHDPAIDPTAPQHDPDHPDWEFAFAGVQMFVVGCTPSYLRRRSRNLGRGMIFLFQPRSVFVDLVTQKAIGPEARGEVRRRLLLWDDGVSAHADLGVYGDTENREWKQYFLPDDDDPVAGLCPFLPRRQAPATDMVALLRRRAAEQPDRIAIRFLVDGETEEAAVDYATLDRRVRLFARQLLKQAAPGDRVMLLLPSGIDYAVAFFACLYAGLIAVPAYPADTVNPQHFARLQAMLSDAGPRLLVTDAAHAGLHQTFGEGAVTVVMGPPADDETAWQPLPVPSDAIAFLQYTSGSTASPKGVMVGHRHLMANLSVLRSGFGLRPDDVMVSWLPLYHDMGLIAGMLSPIFCGFPLVLMSPQHFLGSPARWLRAISRHGGTVGGAPDFAYQLCLDRVTDNQLADVRLDRWRMAWCGAEPIRQATMERFAERFAGVGFARQALYPCYGLAEATLMVSGNRRGDGPLFGRFSAEALAQGRALADPDGVALMDCGVAHDGHVIRIVDPITGEACPDGTVGEIRYVGPSVAGGYWQRAEDESFAGNELRTGDLGFIHNGKLFVCGRCKDLIIIRGQNLYPQDVEQTVSAEVAGLRQGRVSAFSVEVDGVEGIGIAAEMPRAKLRQLDAPAMFRAIGAAVARVHQEPVALILLLNPGDLPRTSSGKLQRSACLPLWHRGALRPAAVYRQGETVDAVAPRDTREAEIAAIWRSLFDGREIGVTDDFFAIGGQSIAAARLAARLSDHYGVAVPLRLVFEAPTVADQARRLAAEELMPQRPIARRAERQDRVPLSPAQERLWFLWRLAPDDTAYVVAGAVRLGGRLDVARLRRALAGVVARHESLRTRFVEEDGTAWQLISEAAEYGWSEEADLAVRPFDLEHGPLLRAALSTVGTDDHELLLSMHHIVSDGWSIPILLQELSALYAGSDLTPLPIQYGDYALAQREVVERRQAGQLAYWRDRLGGEHPELPLPTRERRGPGHGAQLTVKLRPELTARLRLTARHQGATLFTVLLAGFAALLHRYSGQRDIRIGVPSAGRQRLETEGLIGFFVNTLVMRADLSGGLAFADLLAQLRGRLVEAQANQDLPFERLVADLNPERGAGNPLTRVKFLLQEDWQAIERFGDLAARPIALPASQVRFDLALDVTGAGHGLDCCFTYDAGLFAAETVAEMAQRYIALLDAAAGDAAQPIAALPLVDDIAEPVRVFGGNLLSRLAARGDGIALMHQGEAVDWPGLWQWSGRLAGRLHALGVGTEMPVAVALPRGPALVASLLAIWRAGGIYLPLDPALPGDRLAWQVADSGARLVVAEARPDWHEGAWLRPDEEGVPPELPALPADQAAYVIYTSGSTGRPKGVVVSHGALSAYVQALLERLPQDIGSAAYVSTPAADLGHTVLFGALWAGWTLHLIDAAMAFDPDRFADYMREHGVDALKIVPSHLGGLMQAREAAYVLPRRCLILGGEATSAALAARIAALKPDCRLVNHYGPTETTVGVLTRDGHGTAGPNLPLGRPLPHARVVVVDGDGNRLPAGMAGEICIGGQGVARGYLGRPGLTAERFLPDGGGARLYRTGDRGRVLADGEIEFLGRLDDQVKIRGYRVESEEAAGRLRALPGVREAAVIARADAEGRVRLIGYAVGDGLEAETLRSALGAVLPDYLVPQAIVLLERLPLTANGKIDRDALPEPAVAARDLVAPRNAREATLLAIWRKVLKREDIGVTENFFALGGDSILSLQVVAQARRAGLKLTPKQLFDRPDIAGLAASAGTVAAKPVAAALPPVDRRALGLDDPAIADVYPATGLQQGLIYHSLMRPADGVYVNQLRLTLRGPVDEAALRAAWTAAVARHDILRTGFDWRHGGAALQVVWHRADLPWTSHDWSAAAAYEADLTAWRAADVARGFDLGVPPLMRLALFRRPDGDADLIWTNHHAVTDGWSSAQLLAEIALGLADPNPSYRDYVAWAQAQPAGEAWWRAQAELIADPTGLALGRPRRPVAGMQRLSHQIDGYALEAAARRRAVTVNTLVQGAWALCLARHAGRRQVVFGITVSGRPADLAGADRMIGLFINSLPLWVDLPGDVRLDAWLRDLQAHNVALRQHEHTPLSDLQRWTGRSGDALFDSLVVFQNFPLAADLFDSGGLRAVEIGVRTHYPLTLTVTPGAAARLDLAWDGGRFDSDDIERLSQRYLGLLRQLAEPADPYLRDIVLPAEPVAPPATYFFDSVPDRFSRQASLRPVAEAVVCGGERLSYGGVDAWSNRIGRRLKRVGVGREERVGLCLERSVGLAAGLLGILKAGGAYVPLDPAYPAARLEFMIADAGVGRIVVDAATADRFPGHELIRIDEVEAESAAGWVEAIHPEQLAYVIYTSGSTGKPKGVAISHGSLSLHMNDFIGTYGVTADDVVLQLATISFDVGTEQLLPPLVMGARVVMRGPELLEASALNRLLVAELVSIAGFATAYWQQWLHEVPASLPSLRLVMVGGEALPGDALRRWQAGPLAHVRLDNLYGPTETTVTSCLHPTALADADSLFVAIGRGFPGRSLVIVDGDGNPSPTGELCIGGASVGRGYLGRPGLTAERFVPNPFGRGRLYRTGDLCRRRIDGTIEFLGRLDNQVKLRGYRIELGEVEAALRACDGVKAAAAAIRERRLVGYAVGEADPETLKAALAARLPDYLVPSVVVMLDALPLLPNGKTDAAALPEPAVEERELVGSRNGREATLLSIWRGVLKRDDIGVTENFFALGGDSILSLQVVARARQAQLKLTPKQLFEQPTIAALAAVASEMTQSVVAITDFAAPSAAALGLDPAEIEEIYPATPLQQGLIYHSLLAAGDGVYVNQLRLTLRAPLDVAALRAAWGEALDRHAVLRTGFDWRHGGDTLQVVRRRLDLPWGEHDWSDRHTYEIDLAAWREADVAAGFDLAAPPLFRLALFHRPDGDADLIWTNHHALTDGWSGARLLGEVNESYRARQAGRRSALTAPPAYRAYVAWLRTQPSGEAWWRGHLATVADPVGLTFGLGRAAAVEPGSHRLARRLDDLGPRLRAAAQRHAVTLNTLIQAAWALLIARYGGRSEVAFGITVSGRPADLPEVERMLGLFINSLPLWVGLPASRRLDDWLQDLQRHNVGLREREHTALGDLQRWSGRSGDALFDSLVVFENYPVDEALHRAPGGLDVAGIASWDRTHFPLTLTVVPRATLELVWEWDGARFARPAIERLAPDYLDVLDQIAGAGDVVLGEIGLASGAHDAAMASYDFAAVPQRVSRRAGLQPDAEAVSCGEERLSHGGLEAWSNRIGRRLRRLGVVAEERVGLCIERSVGLVAGLLGIWKSGGAYVPLDPGYPAARLAEMIADAGVRRVVTDRGTAEALRDLLSGLDLVVIGEVDEDASALPLRYLPGQLAYVIYTSGSTGKPKGVAISHGSLSLHMDDFIGTYGISADDVVLQSSTVNFDVALHEMFPALIQGGRIVMRGPALWELDGLTRRLADEGVTFARIPTAYWQQWLHVLPESLPALRQVTVGGEGLPGDALRRWQAGPLAHVRLDNLYGPTETTVAALARRTTAADADEVIVPIGVAYPSRSLAVIDGDGNLAPVGGLGELCIGRDTVGRGYLDRPGLTAERFVPDPFGHGGRLYRTGDLCRRRADGTIEFLGRLDQQVKLRGYRIELGEVEAALRACDGVTAAAAAIKGEGENRRLVGYAVGAADGEALKAALAATLPDYLVPSVVVVLDALPLMPNGKTDAAALPEPAAEERDLVQPRDGREAALLSVWRGVLKREDIGVTENFFALGGDSILSLQVVARARQAGLRLTPKQLFEEPTIEALAALATSVTADIAEDASGEIPLTPIQSWFFERFPEGENHWNQSVLLDVREELDLERLSRALNQLVARHDALRLRFTRDHDGWHQTVAAPHPVEIEVADVEDLAEAGTQLQRRLDITDGPLIRAGYYGRHLLLAIHHLAVDGVSWRVLLEELQQAYAGSELPPTGTSWAAWAKRLEAYGRTIGNELGWWREWLAQATGLPGLRPGDRRLSSSRLLSWRLDEAATARLLAAAPRAYRLGVDELLLSALVQAAGQGLLVEVEGHGREDLFDDVDLSRTVGWFTTSYPVWLPDGSPVAVKEALRSVPTKGLHWGLLPHDGLPRADIGFNYLGRFDQSVERDGLFSFSKDSGGRSLSADSELDHALEINGSIANGCLSLSWRYSPGVIEPARVEAMLGRFEVELAALVEHCLAAAPKPTASDYPLAGLTQAQFEALDLGEVQDIYPATGLQQGLLYHGLLKQGDGVYVNQLRLTLKGPLDVAALRAAWNDVVARHDILRTGFEWRHGGEALQVVRRSVELPWVEPDEDIAAWCAADLARGFDLSQAPLLRLALFRRPDGDYDLIRTSHHLLSDGWSSARLLAEVSECYRGRAAELPPPVPYRSYVAWARRQPSSEAWWREAMVEDPVGLTASFGAPTKPEPGIHRIEQPLSELGDRLKRAARRRSVTLNTLMQGAWALLLSRFGAKDAVGFGVTVSGRPASLPGVERMLGLFINSLPLWVELPASRKLDAWLQDLQRRNVELRQYEHTPLSDLQRWTGRSGDALFDSLLVFENYPVDEAVGRGEGGLRAGKVEIAERTHYPLTLTISPAPLALDWAWDGERLERGDVELITGHYLDLLDELAREGDPALGAIGLSAPEAVSEPFDYQFVPVHHRLSPSAVVACEGEAIDGPELAAWSRRIGSQLRRLGVQPDELVGLCVERSPGLVAAMLGVWQSGGAYVPLDPGYPAARLADMIADAGLRRVVVDRATAARLAGLLDGLDLVFVDEGTDEDGSEALHPDRLAYVIYTSGSTGKPKGVGVSHGALDRMLMSMAVRPGLTSDDVWLAVTSLSFDIAALELLLPLIVGARLEIARRDSVQDGRRLAALLESSGATVLQATPLGWRLLLEGGWAGRKLKGLCGGEALPSDLAAALHGRGVTLWNMYGPTETTIWSALSLTQPGQPIELGGPIHDTVLRLVDPAGQVVPAGGIGELCIGGANLARGYLGRAGLTAERFVPDPLGQGTRLYRTGDLCRQRADGRLEFLGRLDTQVKLRGHRIELGEVEAQLRTCPGVKAAAAAVRGAQLVGYAVGAVDGEQLKALLASRLPDYLVPSAVLVLDTLPQTPNGKLDRRALPEPAAAARQVVAPRNPVEQALRDIWAQLLRRDDISVGDSFFDLGGDSLGALRLSALAKGRGLGNLTPATVFARPVLAALASYLQVEAAGLPANILPMNSVGMARTLFCLHPGYGLVGEYRALADALEGQVTVYGVQSPIHAEPDWRAADFDALAADYVRRIRLVQPAGPYHLLGWSHGGLVVAAMARRLEEAGEELGLVGLIDTVAHIDRNVVQPGEAGDDQAEIAALVAGIRGGGWQDHAFDARENEALGRTVAVVRHHHALVQGYALPRLKSDLSLWWAGQAGPRTDAELDWQVHTSGRVRVVATFDTSHAAIVRDSRLIAGVAQLLRESQLGNISLAS